MTKLQTATTTETLAFRFGREDAEKGEACVPEMLFSHKADKAEYAQGWASVAGHNANSRLLAGIEVDYEAEADEYEQDIADRQFWAQGGW